MTTQDHHLPLPMGTSHPQARLKASLNGLGVAMTPAVKCPLPPLSGRDRRKVDAAVAKLYRLDGPAAACAPKSTPPPLGLITPPAAN
jgi:hypothetical protein